ncbi:hypothetical protein RIF23_08880 [Lipingzhangella sp. LS1_29]|uniref:Uncharacterized protein n=1 Tax=Lipingzhangella rawalii TaxID=2055835 RepID=A0ABU2H5W5_9ACTN|nr:hypothetical protein [Lipingzhangella rawalii]MDS1270407.1 hypothetical protein [Lipingzhangella rawalii]
MSNAMRHLVGAVVGVVATPLILGGLTYLIPEFHQAFARFETATLLPLAGALLALGLLIGLGAGSRLSPLATLLPGLVLTVLGLIMTIPEFAPVMFDIPLPGQYLDGSTCVLVGGILIAAALPASQWRAANPARSGGVPPQGIAPPPPGMVPPEHGGAPAGPPSAPQPPYPGTGPQPTGPPPHHPGNAHQAPSGSGPMPAPPAGGPAAGQEQLAGPPPGPGAPVPPPVAGGPTPPPGGDRASGPYPSSTQHPGADEPHLYGTGPIPQIDPNAADPRNGPGH